MSRPSAHHRRRLASIAKKRCKLIRRLALILHEQRLKVESPKPIFTVACISGLDGLMSLRELPWPYGSGAGGPPVTGTIGGRARSLRP